MTVADCEDEVRPTCLMVDFGGVLTSSVLEAFAGYEVRQAVAPGTVARLLREDPDAAALLVEHECGRLSDEDFEDGLVERARVHGARLTPRGLIRGLQSGLRPDEQMIRYVRSLHEAGVGVAVVSNALGQGCYDGYDLLGLATVVVRSNELGVRKPSRGIYEHAARELGVQASQCVLVDDVEVNLAGAARLGVQGVLHVSAAASIARLEEFDLVRAGTAAAS